MLKLDNHWHPKLFPKAMGHMDWIGFLRDRKYYTVAGIIFSKTLSRIPLHFERPFSYVHPLRAIVSPQRNSKAKIFKMAEEIISKGTDV